MKRLLITCCSLVSLLFVALPTAWAEHYVNGLAGLKAGTLPEKPGFYYLMYNLYANADKRMDNDGNEFITPLGKPAFDAKVLANAHRFIWITDKKILGGNYGFNFVVPLIKKSLTVDMPGALPDVDVDNGTLADITVNVGTLWAGTRTGTI